VCDRPWTGAPQVTGETSKTSRSGPGYQGTGWPSRVSLLTVPNQCPTTTTRCANLYLDGTSPVLFPGVELSHNSLYDNTDPL